MRTILACLALVACATAPEPPPGARLQGCWINREAGASMRWMPDGQQAGVLRGVRLSGGTLARFGLRPSDDGWRFCERDGEADARCWTVAEGGGGSLAGGRVFIDGHGDRLRIEIVGDGPSRVIFQGRRDGCD